jgi:uncharacterized membrane protein
MILRVLPWVLWAVLVGFSVLTFDTLPAEIPRHLNSAGAITSSVPRTWFSWMLLPIVALATQWLLFGLAHHLPKDPSLFNFPEKEKFLKLPPAYRGDVIPRMQSALDVAGVFMMLMILFVQWLMWRTALGQETPSTMTYILVPTVLLVPLMLILTSRVNSAVEDAERKWKAAGSPAA